MELDTKRTDPQNKSAHLWFDELADALNASGYTVNSKEVLRLDVPWTKDNVKEFLFRPVMKAMYPDKTSTAQLTKAEWSAVVEALNLALGERVGVQLALVDRRLLVRVQVCPAHGDVGAAADIEEPVATIEDLQMVQPDVA